MILWEQETILLEDIYIPIFTLVSNGVVKIYEYHPEPVDSESPFYGTWGNQPDGSEYPVYEQTGFQAVYNGTSWFGNLPFLQNEKRYAFFVENQTDEPLAESDREIFQWYAGAPEDYTPPPLNQSVVSEPDIPYFGNIGRPDIQDYISRVLNNQSLEDSEFTFPFTDNFPQNQWPHPDSSVVNSSSDTMSDLIDRKSTYIHPYYFFSNPSYNGYWKNIIPKDYSILNREGLDGEIIDTYSEQEWFDNYYYPVLPRYGADGKFIEGDFPNDKTPFPLEGPITDENESDKNLLINIVNEKNDVEVFNDNSGNNNYGFSIEDYKTKFDNKTLRVEKNKKRSIFKTSKRNGAF
jgi:hypothetical protein